jgi:hypothetical protein
MARRWCSIPGKLATRWVRPGARASRGEWETFEVAGREKAHHNGRAQGGLGGRLEARGGAPCRCGSGGDVGGVRGRLVKAVVGRAVVAVGKNSAEGSRDASVRLTPFTDGAPAQQ